MQRRKIFPWLITLGILSGTLLLFIPNSKGFTLRKVRSSFTPSPEWEVASITPYEKKEIKMILEQDFHFLGAGAQSYAFLSADGQYVLKFFKVNHLTPKNWLKLIPLPGLDKYRFRKIDKRLLRKHELFSSYKMAYETLRQETGLIFIHLNKTKDLHIKVKLFDRMCSCYIANLDDYEFVLQQKAQIVRDRLVSHLQKGDVEGARKSVRTLLVQIIHQCKKGFIDRDTGVSNNYGFAGNKVIHFDAGRLVFDEAAKDPSYYQQEILRIGRKLEDWIASYRPDLLPLFEEEINAMLDVSQEDPSPSHRYIGS